MLLKELLLAAILQWQAPWYPPGQNPETPEQYQTRLETIAEAVALEAKAIAPAHLDSRALAAATLTVWYGETRFAYEVHALGTSRWKQDRGKARCMGQLHVSKLVPADEWEQMVGADLQSTRRCARATIRVLLAVSRYCGAAHASEAHMARVFAAYGSGQGCGVDQRARSRARRWARLLSGI
jgi:hypothetical protein